jgi:hypothetical protein
MTWTRIQHTFTIIGAVCLLLALTLAALPVSADDDLATHVVPSQGPPGTTFSFLAEGFAANEQVLVSINTPQGVERLTGPRGDNLLIFADSTGRATWSYRAPDSAVAGSYTAIGQGVNSGRQRDITFAVEPGQTQPPQPQPGPQGNATVVPGTAPAGTTFTFVARGYNAGERVGHWIHTPGGHVVPLDSNPNESALNANSNGVVIWEYTPNRSIPPGTYVAVFQGVNSGVVNTVSFVVQ